MVNRLVFDTNILMATENFSKMLTDLNHEYDNIILFEVLAELDNLKSKEGQKGMQARRAVRNIKAFIDKFTFCESESNEATTDSRIVDYAKKHNATVITNDIAMELRSKALGVKTENYYEVKEIGRGYKEVELNEPKDTILTFLSPLGKDLEIGEYLIINRYGAPYAAYVKTGLTSYEVVPEQAFESVQSGKIVPLDLFQSCAFDSLNNNQLTFLTGKAGTGKTLISISKMVESLESGDVDKIVIFTNPTKARGAEQLGFYTGDRNMKLIQNSIGSILSSKLGSQMKLEEMIADETILIMPMSDIRGYEVPETAYLYISEAQNADADLLQLAIQRISGGPAIIEGDPYTQLDHWSYGGENNGMLRGIEVFKEYEGLERFPDFAHVHLPNIYRSKLAERADLMTN